MDQTQYHTEESGFEQDGYTVLKNGEKDETCSWPSVQLTQNPTDYGDIQNTCESQQEYVPSESFVVSQMKDPKHSLIQQVSLSSNESETRKKIGLVPAPSIDYVNYIKQNQLSNVQGDTVKLSPSPHIRMRYICYYCGFTCVNNEFLMSNHVLYKHSSQDFIYLAQVDTDSSAYTLKENSQLFSQQQVHTFSESTSISSITSLLMLYSEKKEDRSTKNMKKAAADCNSENKNGKHMHVGGNPSDYKKYEFSCNNGTRVSNKKRKATSSVNKSGSVDAFDNSTYPCKPGKDTTVTDPHYCCKVCNFVSYSYDQISEHIEGTHLDGFMRCCVEGCKYLSKSVASIQGHHNANHHDDPESLLVYNKKIHVPAQVSDFITIR